MNVLSAWMKAFLAMLILIILAGGFWFYHRQELSVREQVEKSLTAVAMLKTKQIATWRETRLEDAAVLMESPFLAEAISRWLVNQRTDLTEEIQTRFRSLQKHYHYHDILLLSPCGQVLLSLTGATGSPHEEALEALAVALRDRRPVLTDLHADEISQMPHLSTIAPIFSGPGQTSQPIAAIVLLNDARQFLYPLIESWPSPSSTAETVLVRREGSDILHLNNLRHQPDTALKLRIPLSQGEMPAAMALQGREGFVQSRDYRGVEVVSVIRPIPDSSWIMVAKVDRAEAFADWRFDSILILVLLAGLVTLTFASGLLLWQRGQKSHFQALYLAEEARRQSEARYRMIFNTASVGIALTDLAGRWIDVNERGCRIFGYTKEELLHKSNLDLTYPDDMEATRKAMQRLADEASAEETLEKRYIRKDGSLVWVELWITALRDEQSRTIALLGMANDITLRKQAEEEREQLQAQLIQAQKMESVGRLAGGVAHDFNNMLGVILGHTELALEDAKPGSLLQEELEEIQKAALRSANLTRQLLAFARKQTIAPKVLDLNDTIEGMIKMLRRLIGEDIALAWLPDADLWSVKIDPSQIDQLLANLCVNARDAIAGVGKVTIETINIGLDKDYCANHLGSIPGDYVMLAVSDNGCGMEQNVLEHIFEPFFTTKGIGQGTGLGMATVYGIVKQNQGFLNVYSEPGQGTTVKAYLPRFIGDAVTTLAASTEETYEGHGETILVVEDEATMLALSKAMLERQGYRVLAAGTPGEALQQVETYAGEIRLLITDVVMPELNGPDLAAQIKAIKPGLRCLFMSGYTANAIAHHGVLDQGVLFIQKPFSRKDLAVKVREALA